MDDTVQHCLSEALAAAVRAAARDSLFALRAAAQGLPELALFFRAAARAAEVRAGRLTRLFQGRIGDTPANLEEFLARNRAEFDILLPACMENAAEQGEATAATVFRQFRAAAGNHGLHARRLAGDPGQAPEAYFVCGICGYLHPGTAPERCPVCAAAPSRFAEVR